jgi:hypothetical protein
VSKFCVYFYFLLAFVADSGFVGMVLQNHLPYSVFKAYKNESQRDDWGSGTALVLFYFFCYSTAFFIPHLSERFLKNDRWEPSTAATNRLGIWLFFTTVTVGGWVLRILRELYLTMPPFWIVAMWAVLTYLWLPATLRMLRRQRAAELD